MDSRPSAGGPRLFQARPAPAAAEVGIIWAAHNLGFWQATAAVGPEIRARAPSAIAQRAEALLEAVLELVTKNALAEPRGVAGAETRH